MGIRIGFNPAASTTHAGMGSWAGPGGGAPQGYALGGPGYGYNPAIVDNPNLGYNPPGSVSTGNEFGTGVPAFAPSQWGTFDTPTLNPTIGFNNQPYVETFNAGFPVQMNPAFNIDNIVTPTIFGGYPYQTGPYAYPGNQGYGGPMDGGFGGGLSGGTEGRG